MKNLEKLSRDGKYLFLAYDHGLEHGPFDFNDKSINPNYVLDIAVEGEYQGIVLQKGIAEKYYKNSPYEEKIPLILKLNGKTKLFKGEPYSPQECSFSFAEYLGASAVGYTIYIGSKYEAQMFKEFGGIVEEAYMKKIPVIAWMYPRGKSVKNPKGLEAVAYAARVGLELGADIIKLEFRGSKRDFSYIAKSAGKAKVVLAGGSKLTENEFLKTVSYAIESGFSGVAIGRNIWQRENPLSITKKLKSLIFK